MHIIVSDRQHVKAAQAAIFSLFLESDDALQTLGIVDFSQNVHTARPLLLLNTKMYCACTLFFH